EKENKHYCIRNFKISHSDKPEQVRDIRQFHYTSWPDFGVPTTGEGVMEMREEIIGWQGKAPPVVHCSAGVGRTGTYVAIDTGLAQQAANKREANIYQLTETMKKQRQGMVQTPEQYEFIYTTLRQADAVQPE
ncbi:protein-tyrosine phosphatase, partial [Sphaeroforma arctica JP610]